MKIAHLVEEGGRWFAEAGMDPGYGNPIASFDRKEEALERLSRRERPETLLVLEEGSMAAYDDRLRLEGSRYEPY